MPSHINFGKVEVFYFPFTNIVIQFVTQILLKYSSQSLTPVKGSILTKNLPVLEQNVQNFSVILSCTNALFNEDVCIL